VPVGLRTLACGHGHLRALSALQYAAATARHHPAVTMVITLRYRYVM
jgi:hypothetical protein